MINSRFVRSLTRSCATNLIALHIQRMLNELSGLYFVLSCALQTTNVSLAMTE